MQRSRRRFRIHFSLIALIGDLLIGRLAASQEIEVGYRDLSYPVKTGGDSRPTGEKPESKLWFNDGVWWGILWSGDATTGAYHIYYLDGVTQDWVDTGTVVDARLKSRADAAWDGTHLYVASHIFSSEGQPTTKVSDRGRLYRF